MAESRCRFCGGSVGETAVGRDLCGHPRCLAERGRIRQMEFRRDVAEAARRRARWLAEKLRPGVGGIPVAIVPLNERLVAPLPAERREAFLEHVRAAIATPWTPPPGAAPANAKVRSTPLTRAACALCLGACCLPGGSHQSFLAAMIVRRLSRERPGLTAEQILAICRTAFPVETYVDSCLYHSPTGCTLPDHARPLMCDDYLCPALNAFLGEAIRTAATLGFAVCEGDAAPPRCGFLTPTGLERPDPPEAAR